MFARVGDIDPPCGVLSLVGNSSPSIYKPRFQELFQYRFVHWDVFDKPVMADMVKTPFNVTLQYPLWGITAAERCENIFAGILRAAPLAEAEGFGICRCLGYWV